MRSHVPVPSDEDIYDEEVHRDDLSQSLDALTVARGLLSHLIERSPNHGLPDQYKHVSEEFLLWPPDLFAFTSSILSQTGAYHNVVSPPNDQPEWAWPPVLGYTDDGVKSNWAETMRIIGIEWRKKLDSGSFTGTVLSQIKSEKDHTAKEAMIKRYVGFPKLEINSISWLEGEWLPRKVGEIWVEMFKAISAEGKGDINDIVCESELHEHHPSDKWSAFTALITLHAIADEACAGWGIRKNKHSDIPHPKKAVDWAAERLSQLGTLSTINCERCRILPKRHTPSVGITLRSLSSNLGYHRSSIKVKWHVPNQRNDLADKMTKKDKTFSALLIPWPLVIKARDFVTQEPDGYKFQKEENSGFFAYAPRDNGFDWDSLEKALNIAKNETKNIDMIVLPECAIDEAHIKQFESVISSAQHAVSTYLAGVRRVKQDGHFHDNMVFFKVGRKLPNDSISFEDLTPGKDVKASSVQYKHHRWKIGGYQVTNYSLGHVLSPYRNWWEAIRIHPRKVSFVNIGEELTVCPLICEDLARQDPIADLIRTVGPSLVITILMDGPQKLDRWSAKYASVLAEDPGSAVITLTSSGMVDRWRPQHNAPSRVVALWNDGQGSAREIELEPGAVGILLSLSLKEDHESTSDGRRETWATNRIVLGGVYQIKPVH